MHTVQSMCGRGAGTAMLRHYCDRSPLPHLIKLLEEDLWVGGRNHGADRFAPGAMKPFYVVARVFRMNPRFASWSCANSRLVTTCLIFLPASGIP